MFAGKPKSTPRPGVPLASLDANACVYTRIYTYIYVSMHIYVISQLSTSINHKINRCMSM